MLGVRGGEVREGANNIEGEGARYELDSPVAFRGLRAEGKTGYAGVRECGAWLGLDTRGLEEKLPCLQQVEDRWAGQGECGERVYCRVCAEVIQVLGRAWHLGCATGVVKAVVQKGLFNVESRALKQEVHRCGGDCAVRRAREREWAAGRGQGRQV